MRVDMLIVELQKPNIVSSTESVVEMSCKTRPDAAMTSRWLRQRDCQSRFDSVTAVCLSVCLSVTGDVDLSSTWCQSMTMSRYVTLVMESLSLRWRWRWQSSGDDVVVWCRLGTVRAGYTESLTMYRCSDSQLESHSQLLTFDKKCHPK